MAKPGSPRLQESPRLYLVLDRTATGGRALDDILLAALQGGAEMVQLREKTWPSGTVLPVAQRLLGLCRAAGVPFIITDRVDLAVAVDADGVHLGQDDLPPAAARELLGERAVIGFSTHSAEQAREAARLPVDYIAIGPVFETSSKENPDPVVGLEGLRRVRQIVGQIPLVAIGGVRPENLSEVLRAGADSVAVISLLLGGGPPEIETRTRAIFAALPPES